MFAVDIVYASGGLWIKEAFYREQPYFVGYSLFFLKEQVARAVAVLWKCLFCG